MRLTTEQCLTAIEQHTRGLAVAAAGNLDARIEHCPEWSMADLVWHLTGVHRFWEHVARERPSEPPELPEVERPSEDALVPGMLAAMEQMVSTLRAADQGAACWTWGLDEHVRFITRHQVQEAAVHHWDAAQAAGSDWSMDEVAAADAVEEFLTESVGNARWPREGIEPLGGVLWFCPCSDDGEWPQWFIFDGDVLGTVAFTADSKREAALDVGAHTGASEVLLWLYGRIPDDWVFGNDMDPDRKALIQRFRAGLSTD